MGLSQAERTVSYRNGPIASLEVRLSENSSYTWNTCQASVTSPARRITNRLNNSESTHQHSGRLDGGKVAVGKDLHCPMESDYK